MLQFLILKWKFHLSLKNTNNNSNNWQKLNFMGPDKPTGNFRAIQSDQLQLIGFKIILAFNSFS